MKIHFKQNGCEATLFDSEKIKQRILADCSYESSSEDNADTLVFHSCTFSRQKEEESKQLIQELLSTNAKTIIVSGCFLNQYIKDERIHYIKNGELKDFIEGLKGLDEQEFQAKANTATSLSPVVAISRGCYGNCTFCSIKNAKGKHKSRPIKEILNDIEVRKHHGFIKLVGEEVAGYGMDSGSGLGELFVQIIKEFPDLRIKFGSLNAKLLKRFSVEDLSIFAHPNVSGNVHIPVQSASNKILKAMSRGYTFEEYKAIYEVLRRFGTLRISGDLICGFPGEDEADHQKNLNLFSNYSYDYMQIFMYQERPDTVAAKMKQVDPSVRKRRTAEVIVKYQESYSKWHNISYDQLSKLPSIFNTNI